MRSRVAPPGHAASAVGPAANPRSEALGERDDAESERTGALDRQEERRPTPVTEPGTTEVDVEGQRPPKAAGATQRPGGGLPEVGRRHRVALVIEDREVASDVEVQAHPAVGEGVAGLPP